ncbi:MAG: SDR family oxidoreductase [Acidobacteria bacterium]|nr:SDR family oxidoreductase [Acidobacteriota bacterium]
MSNTFGGARALVTGASRGIGRAVARELAAGGTRLAVHYGSDEAAAHQTAGTLDGGPHEVVGADLARPGAGRRLVEEAVSRLGGLDIVVNNAGIYHHHPPGSSGPEQWDDAWQRTLQVNLVAVAEICHAAIAPLRTAGGGRIVNISSRGAFRGEPEAPAYGASKAGLNALSQSLAKALAPEGIFVYVVAPGWVETEMAAPYLAGPGGDEIRAQIPLGRPATPEEVARAVCFLASPGTDSMTGCILDVNGASYLRT